MNGLLSLFRSTDDGIIWTGVTTGIYEQIWRLTAAGSTLLLGTPNGLYKSTDNGVNWTNHLDGLNWTQLGYLAVDPSGYIYAGTQSGLYKSSQAIPLGVKELSNEIPSSFSLSQNYPNPFNPKTDLRFEIRDLSFVTLKVFDILGQEVATLVHGQLQPGSYSADWNASNQPSGIYFYRLQAGEFTETKRMVLMK